MSRRSADSRRLPRRRLLNDSCLRASVRKESKDAHLINRKAIGECREADVRVADLVVLV